MTLDVKTLLQTVMDNKASDLHLVAGSEPQVRLDGRLVAMELPVLDGERIEELCYALLSESQKATFEETNELDFAVNVPDVGRFRGNLYKTLGSIAAAFRAIPHEIPSLDTLQAPAIYREIVKREKGLILVTGPTGSGKTTTLGALLHEINLTERKHIICVEDPVEFLHQNKRSLFSYRTVGEDTESFSRALKASMREDPDVIMVGEMRDKETIRAAITAAETGHLVFGTLHTNSASGTINRIIDVFGGEEQPQIRAQLSVGLVAAISQMLIPKIGGGRVAAPEILINSPAIGNLIRENKIHQIPSQMMIGQGRTGMQTQSQILQKLVKEGSITKEHALQYSNEPDELKNKLGGM
jgi:twitching motility protein PilT